MARYNERFYRRRHEKTLPAARRTLGVVFGLAPELRSVVDVGCGVGTWLEAAKELGASNVFGFDGPWVPAEHRLLDQRQFQSADLNHPPAVPRRFDLAITLEVAEHVAPKNADGFVEFMTHLGDMVLFGAAVPGQGGVGHVNEQWPEYWAEKFAARGYRAYDVVRPAIWRERDIAFWYKQNTVLYANRAAIESYPALAATAPLEGPPMPMIHPELFERVRLGKTRWYLEQWKRKLRGQRDALTV